MSGHRDNGGNEGYPEDSIRENPFTSNNLAANTRNN